MELAQTVDPELASLLRGGFSPLFAVEAQAVMDERGAAHVAAIVDLSDSFEGARIFRWLDRVPIGWGDGGGIEDDEEQFG